MVTVYASGEPHVLSFLEMLQKADDAKLSLSEERAFELRLQAAAIKLQANVRGKLSRRVSMELLKAQADAKIIAASLLQSTTPKIITSPGQKLSRGDQAQGRIADWHVVGVETDVHTSGHGSVRVQRPHERLTHADGARLCVH